MPESVNKTAAIEVDEDAGVQDFKFKHNDGNHPLHMYIRLMKIQLLLFMLLILSLC